MYFFLFQIQRYLNQKKSDKPVQTSAKRKSPADPGTTEKQSAKSAKTPSRATATAARQIDERVQASSTRNIRAAQKQAAIKSATPTVEEPSSSEVDKGRNKNVPQTRRRTKTDTKVPDLNKTPPTQSAQNNPTRFRIPAEKKSFESVGVRSASTTSLNGSADARAASSSRRDDGFNAIQRRSSRLV